VLLWLDDLDDLVFCAALASDRLRRGLLKFGLTAACALACSELSATVAILAPAFTAVAVASVAAWLLGAALRLICDRDPRVPTQSA